MQRFRDGWRIQRRLPNGKRVSRFFLDKEEGRRFELELELGIESPELMTSQNPKWKEFSKRWLAEYSKVEKGRNSHDEDCRVVKRHLSTFDERTLKSLKKGDLVEFKATLLMTGAFQKKKALKPKSVNNILMVAKKILGYAVDLGLLHENPWRGVKPCKVGTQVFDYWLADERDNFYFKAVDGNPDLADLAYLACHTGMRKGELAALSWGGVDFERKKIQIHQSYSVRLKNLGPTKGGEVTEIPMNEIF